MNQRVSSDFASPGILRTGERALQAVEKFGVGLAGLLMLAIMFVVVADVALRYLFNAPLSWSYELISVYLMVGLFFSRCPTRSPRTPT